MASFDFITSQDFRKSLEADYHELTSCFDTGSWKSVHVLAGSIVEAILIDYLVADRHVSWEDALKLDFGQAIKRCNDAGMISQKTVELSTVIKGYRNLIHPGRLIRLGETVDASSAKVAQALVDIVLDEVAKQRRNTYGYTAEQLVSKLERDPTATAILSHLLKATNAREVDRLLMSVLPEHYFLNEEHAFDDRNTLSALKLAFRMAFDLSSDDLRIKVCNEYVRILKEEAEAFVSTYEYAFVSMQHLKYLSIDDRDLVIQHVLAQLQRYSDARPIRLVAGIGEFIKGGDVDKLVDPLVRTMCSKATSRLGELAQQRLVEEWRCMPREVDQVVIVRLNDWVRHYKDGDQTVSLEKVEAVLLEIDDIPF